MVGVAVNVTDVPKQTGFSLTAILTATGKLVFTVIVIAFEVAGFPVVQDELEVKIQVTTSLLAGINEWVGELVPTLLPFFFH